LHARELGVLAGDRLARRVDAGALHRRDRAGRHAVVGDIDRVEAGLAEAADRLVHLGLRLVRAPVGRVVALDDLDARLLEDGQRRLGLRLLLGDVLVGVGVDDLTARAQLPDPGFKVGLVLLVVARRLGLRQQQRDLAAAAAASAVVGPAAVRRAAGGDAEGEG